MNSVPAKSPEAEAPRTGAPLTALEKLFSRIGELTAPPAIAVQIINVTSDDSASIDPDRESRQFRFSLSAKSR